MNELVRTVMAGIDSDPLDQDARETAVEALLLLAARAIPEPTSTSEYPHRCFTDEGDWVSCPAELCEADFLLREAIIRQDENARLAALLRKECGSAARFREIYNGTES